MKKTLYLSLLLSTSTIIEARSIDVDSLNAYSPSEAVIVHTSSADARKYPDLSAHLLYVEESDAKTLIRAKDIRANYLRFFKALDDAGGTNFQLFNYILNGIYVSSPIAQANGAEPDMLLPERQTAFALEFLYLNDEEIKQKQYTQEELLKIAVVLETVLHIYTKYEASVWDSGNFNSVKGQRWLEEGVLQIGAIHWQQNNKLSGLVDYETLSVVRTHNDIAEPSRIIERVNAAFIDPSVKVVTFPLNIGNGHWIMLAIQSNGEVAIIDSMTTNRSSMTALLVKSLNAAKIENSTGKVITFKAASKKALQALGEANAVKSKTNTFNFKAYKGSYGTGLQHRDGWQCGIHSLAYCFAIAAQGSIAEGLKFVHSNLETGATRTFEDIVLKRATTDAATTNAKLVPFGFRGVQGDRDLFAQALRLDLEQLLINLHPAHTKTIVRYTEAKPLAAKKPKKPLKSKPKALKGKKANPGKKKKGHKKGKGAATKGALGATK